jgi:predicted permease
MGWLRRLWQRERELDEELEAHLAIEIHQRMQAGEPREAAERSARRAFGGVARARDRVRDEWRWAWLDGVARDLRHGVRSAGREPAFTAVAILTLAIAIGANTAVFTVARAVLFAPLPVPHPERLAIVAQDWHAPAAGRGVMNYNSTSYRDPASGRDFGSNFSYRAFSTLRASSAGLADLFAFSAIGQAKVVARGGATMAAVVLASGDYYSALQADTALGRPLVDADDQQGRAPVAVISHAFWARAFGADPAAIGSIIEVNGVPVTIVGVTRPGFFGVSKGGYFRPTDVTLPLSAQPAVNPRWTATSGSLFQADEAWWLRIMARVRPGVAPERLEAALDGPFLRSLRTSPIPALRQTERAPVRVLPGGRGVDTLYRAMEQPLRLLGAVAAIVLLLACLNLANLMLARGIARQKELAIRMALGSGRFRLAQQVFAESLVPALAGGVVGLPFGLWGAQALFATLGANSGPIAVDLSLNVPILVATASLSCAAALVFGMVPAVRVATRDAAPALKHVAAGDPMPRLRSARALLGLQVAVSLPLIVGASLFLRTIGKLARVDLGFAPERLVMFTIDPAKRDLPQDGVERTFTRVLDRVVEIPGVASATLADIPLVSGTKDEGSFSAAGGRQQSLFFNLIGPRFFETMAMPLVAGRSTTARDHGHAPRVAVLNESAARRLFGGPALGRQVRLTWGPTAIDFEIVGVVRDSRYTDLRSPMPPTVFLPYAQVAEVLPIGRMTVIVRAVAAASAVAAAIPAAVADVDRELPVAQLTTETEQIEASVGPERMFTRLLVTCGAFALLLACIGLHGVTAYSVARRTGEFGVRIALGAGRSAIVWLALRQVAVVTIVGLAVGVPLSIASARIVRATLFGVEPWDPASLAAAAGVMVAIAALGAYIPARAASRVSPLVALRAE